MKKVLVDLSAAGEGFTGIGHDSRLNFSMLSGLENVSVSGLVYPIGRPVIPRLRKKAKRNLAKIAAILHGASLGWGGANPRDVVGQLLVFLYKARGSLRTNHEIVHVPDWMVTDAFWRVLFQKSLAYHQRAQILAKDYYVSDLGYMQMADRSDHFPWLPSKEIHADGFDAILMPHPRPLRVSRGVRKVVRYHDAIPITHPDMVLNSDAITRHYRYTMVSAQDGVFVCNSPMSVDDLDNLVPGARERAVVIPCAIHSRNRTTSAGNVADILGRRFSLQVLGLDDVAAVHSPIRKSIERSLYSNDKIQYIISVSALEPRKNFTASIAAWDLLRRRTGRDIKFVIVSSGGWFVDVSHKAMRRHMSAGDILHISDVPQAELQALYEGADCCVFPSYAEGFGYAPMEALQMGTPSVVSDLAVFRWSLGDAALYADPYNIPAISEAVELLLNTPENAERREAIRQKAAGILDRFSIDTISRQWAAFFEEDMERLFKKPAPYLQG